MAYLVTGGTGFIGSYVVRDLLKAGKDVVCMQRSGITPIFRGVVGEDNIDKVKIVQGDMSNAIVLFNVIKEYNIDTVAHIGFILMSGGISEAQPSYTLQVNCVGMSNILEAARLFGIRKIVWTSSAQALGTVGELYKEPIKDDNAIYMPDSMYSATKVLDEFMSRLYFRKFGVDSVGFRIGFILGVDKPLGRGGSFTKFLKQAATNVPVTMAAVDADWVRTLGYVENVSDLIVKACEAPTTKTRTYNATEYHYSIRQLVEVIQRVNPGAKVTLKNGVSMEEATWGGSAEPKMDTTGLQNELGWKPKYSLEEALTKIFNHFRQQESMPLL